MNSDEQCRMKFDMLINEYNQHFEHARHEQKLIVSTQTIFVPISYGILAYTTGQDIDRLDLFFAGLTSILIYAFHIILCERMTMRLDLDGERIIEVETEISELTGSEFAWTKNYKSRFNQRAAEFHPQKSANPFRFYDWIAFLSGKIRNRTLRSSMLIALIALWGVRIL